MKRRGSDVKYVAKVLAVGAECDIALMTVDDPAFWKDVEPVCFGQLPQLQDAVTVVGYPIGKEREICWHLIKICVGTWGHCTCHQRT